MYIHNYIRFTLPSLINELENSVKLKLFYVLFVYNRKKHKNESEVIPMLWWIIGIAIVFSVFSSILRRKLGSHSYDEMNKNDRIIQEEDRAKANSWFTGGQ